MFSSFAWEPQEECRHVILDGAVSGRHAGAKKSYEARLRTTVIVLEMSTLGSANNNVKGVYSEFHELLKSLSKQSTALKKFILCCFFFRILLQLRHRYLQSQPH